LQQKQIKNAAVFSTGSRDSYSLLIVFPEVIDSFVIFTLYRQSTRRLSISAFISGYIYGTSRESFVLRGSNMDLWLGYFDLVITAEEVMVTREDQPIAGPLLNRQIALTQIFVHKDF